MRTDIDTQLAAFLEVCRRAGLKATHQRTEIYRELARTVEHPDAETIWRRVRKRIPAISFDTVYRTLRTLEEKGVIARVGSPFDRSRFDAKMERHHHFVCGRCGLVRDFQCEAFDGLRVPDAAKAFGVAQTLQVEIRGVCAECRAKQRG